MDIDWRKVVGTVAPGLATALYGPLAGVAVKALSETLLGRDDGTEAEVAAAVTGGGVEALAKIKEADRAFAVRMRELDIDLEKISQADRASARDREVKTGDRWTPRILGAVVLLTFGWTVYYVLAGKVPGLKDPAVATTIGTLLGYLSAKADQVIAYFFGSSASSAQKNELLARKPPA